jgi:hypothetical protein
MSDFTANLTKLEQTRVVRIAMNGSEKARIILTGNGEKLYLMISFDCNNWETLIKRGLDPEDQSKKLFGVQAKDHSALWLTQSGDIVLDSTRIYGNGPSDLYLTLIGCKSDVKKGQSGKVAVSSSANFPYPQDLSWVCDDH